MEINNRNDFTLEGRLVSNRQVNRIHVQNGLIIGVEPVEGIRDDTEFPWIGPGLIDMQINGYSGIDFNTVSLTEDDVIKATRLLWKQGVTAYLPTVITNSDEAIKRGVAVIARARTMDSMTQASIPGIHLEGPFLSPYDGPRGAHEEQYIQEPNWNVFQGWQAAAEGTIRMITLSPEWNNSVEFIRKCNENNIIVSIGHTSASPEQIRSAIDAGATMSTHLGNGSHLMLPRHPNYIWEQLAADELTVSVIADGFHLPKSVLKVFLRAKGNRIILVSDAVYLSGMQSGKYETHIGGQVILSEEGKLYMASNPKLLAGSAQLLPAGIGFLVSNDIVTLADAWDMASLRPANLLGLHNLGRIEIGAKADLVTFTSEQGSIRIVDTFKDGCRIGNE